MHGVLARRGKHLDLYQLLDWDSAFFGFKVARILPERLSPSQLAPVIAELRAHNVSLAYWAADPADPASQEAATACGGLLADRKATFIAEVAQCSPLPVLYDGLIEEYTAQVPDTDLESLAIQAGIYSRFKVDAKIPEDKFLDLYRLWIRNSVNGQIADAVLVARHEGRIAGMVTVGEKNGRSDIGLIAVDESMRGKNLGIALVGAAKEWARSKGYRFAQVVTQRENLAACRLYEKCGYTIEKIENIYHLWMQ